MKRKTTLTIFAAFIFAASVALPLWGANVTVSQNKGAAFVDANGDGVCDNYTARSHGQGLHRGTNAGRKYVDTDNDGVCDNSKARKVGSAHRGNGRCAGTCDGTGKRQGVRNGNGAGVTVPESQE